MAQSETGKLLKLHIVTYGNKYIYCASKNAILCRFFLLQKISETKLRSLYTDLLAQDKEESTLKRLKSDGLDKDGLKEASVRKKFKGLCCHDD